MYMYSLNGVIRSNDCVGPTGEKKIRTFRLLRAVDVPVYIFIQVTAARFSEYVYIRVLLHSTYYVVYIMYNTYVLYTYAVNRAYTYVYIMESYCTVLNI